MSWPHVGGGPWACAYKTDIYQHLWAVFVSSGSFLIASYYYFSQGLFGCLLLLLDLVSTTKCDPPHLIVLPIFSSWQRFTYCQSLNIHHKCAGRCLPWGEQHGEGGGGGVHAAWLVWSSDPNNLLWSARGGQSVMPNKVDLSHWLPWHCAEPQTHTVVAIATQAVSIYHTFLHMHLNHFNWLAPVLTNYQPYNLCAFGWVAGVYLAYRVFTVSYKQADYREPSLDDAVWLVKGWQPSDPHVLPTGATLQLGGQLQPPPSSVTTSNTMVAFTQSQSAAPSVYVSVCVYLKAGRPLCTNVWFLFLKNKNSNSCCFMNTWR